MKGVIIFLLGAIIGGFLMGVKHTPEGVNATNGKGFSDMDVLTHPTENRCIGIGTNSNIQVVLTELPADVGGQYNYETKVISLADMTIEVIAHEVSHAVEDILKQEDIRDEHLEAYLQGTLTQCVYDIVVREHERAGLTYPQ